MKFAKDVLLDIENEDLAEDSPYKIIEEGDWEVDYKCQYKEIIFSFEDKFYRLMSSRSGSPFTDYDYESEYWPDFKECPEVEKVAVVKTEWRNK